MNQSKKINNIYPYLFSLGLIVFITVAVIFAVCFINPNQLYNLIIKYDGAKTLPFTISNDDIRKIATELMNYLSGQSVFLETKVIINGTLTDFYSLRSKIHMGDVKQIFQYVLFSSYIAIAVVLVSGFKLCTSFENPLKILAKAFTKTLIYVGAFLIIIFIFAAINFDTFFISFHKLLFTNDYWLLDPNTDYIICLLPETLFMHYGLMIFVITIVCLVLVALLLQLLSKILLPQEAK